MSGDGHPHLHRTYPGGAAVPGRAVRLEIPRRTRELSGDVADIGGERVIS